LGAFYTSIQVPKVTHDELGAVLRRVIDEPGIAGIELYFGDAIDRWTAVYPKVCEQMDRLATRVSKELQCLVLTLGSYDEDDFLLNANVAGKDLGFFKITLGKKRTGKQRDPVVKRLDLLAPYCSQAERDALLEVLSDTRKETFGSDLLRRFCRTVGIRNAATSFDYIERGDYAGDLDVACEFERLPSRL
jgi:hypothetical protein